MPLLQTTARHTLAYGHCVAYSYVLTLLCKHMDQTARLKTSLLLGFSLFWLPILSRHLSKCNALTCKQSTPLGLHVSDTSCKPTCVSSCNSSCKSDCSPNCKCGPDCKCDPCNC